jgi:hypothetical protein
VRPLIQDVQSAKRKVSSITSSFKIIYRESGEAHKHLFLGSVNYELSLLQNQEVSRVMDGTFLVKVLQAVQNPFGSFVLESIAEEFQSLAILTELCEPRRRLHHLGHRPEFPTSP